ncbi:MepB family protein [Cytophaga aurantiaca]|uniref:MepB family protein n=1 Tax=Cytophaga aurantiaca TaxID=29530 RepID=UPI00037E927E|nr:MepB family protein [Cytophaga aurantiaca]
MTSPNSLHSDLLLAKELIYDVCGLEFKNFQQHTESTEYAACSYELNGNKIEHRCSKITPTKIGQFVTIWKRNAEGITAPFDVSDGIDFIIITVRSDENIGQFIFPIPILADKGIVSRKGSSGKRGIRVYPPWDQPTSKQALATQAWQSGFFLAIKNEHLEDRMRKLLTGQ